MSGFYSPLESAESLVCSREVQVAFRSHVRIVEFFGYEELPVREFESVSREIKSVG